MKRLGITPILLFILTACIPAQPTFQSWQPWLLSNLHLLESPNTTDPTSDLIAVYSRQHGDDFQIRLDLLNLQPDFNFDIYILLNTTSAGNLVQIPGSPPLVNSAISNQG